VCGAPLPGNPVVSAVTDATGQFTLKGVPVGVNIPLVIQTGRWRRQVTIPSTTQCGDTALPQELTRLPRNKQEGDIPLVAVSTGSLDSVECIFRRIGVDDAEFTLPTSSGGTGRIQLYLGNGAAGVGGANPPGGSVVEDNLWTTQAALNQYDMVLFGCQGNEFDKAAAVQTNMINYANAGGRVYAEHYNYVWLFNDAPFSTTATWNVNPVTGGPADMAGIVNTAFAKGATMASWLVTVGASTTPGIVPMTQLRSDFTGVATGGTLWLSDQATPTIPLDYTFNTPVGVAPTQQCGRVRFADHHPEYAASPTTGMTFPTECPTMTMTMTQAEKLLEYEIFDLGACISPDN
jgi:hypothetical protein